jgi:hypothetical protein
MMLQSEEEATPCSRLFKDDATKPSYLWLKAVCYSLMIPPAQGCLLFVDATTGSRLFRD